MDIEKLQKLINESNMIVFFGGAGVSTDSGLKDFRGKNGLYKEKTDYSPEYMLSSDCLYRNTSLFFEYYKNNMDFRKAIPNVTHNYLKKLEDLGKLKAIITQNIDGLHTKAGSKNVLEIHGTINRAYCIKCYKEYGVDYIFESDGIPKCSCGGMVRPDVTLYGENLPKAFEEGIEYISKADLLIVAGTSLTVFPAAGMLRYFKGRNLVIINENETPYDSMATLVIHKPLKDVFERIW